MKDINRLKKLPLWDLLSEEEKILVESNLYNVSFKKGELIPKKSESCFGKDINRLKKLPLWDLLSEEEKILVESNLYNVSFKKGELIPKKSESCFGIIFVKKGSLRVHIISEDGRDVTLYRIREGEMCTLSSLIPKKSESCFGIIFVKKGSLRVHIISEDGRDVTLYRIREGEMCTLSSSCVLDAITFEVHIEAEENTEIINVPSNIFKKIMEDNIYVKTFMYEGIAARFSDVMWIMQQILFMGIDKRIAIFLMEESESTGKEKIKRKRED